jgi:hypothetical protein
VNTESGKESPDRLRDRKAGLAIVGTAFLAALCVSWWARGVATPNNVEPPPPATSDGVVGFPAHVDVIRVLETAHEHTKRTELRAIVASGVASDGTVDVSNPGRRIRYVFTSARGEGPQAPHPAGTLPRRDFCGRQVVHVKTEGIVSDPDLPTATCLATHNEPLPAPHCGPKEVWKAAIHRGVAADKLANIEYFRADAGPAWRFSLPDGSKTFVLYGDCERELTGNEATGAPAP